MTIVSKAWIFVAIALALAACASTPAPQAQQYVGAFQDVRQATLGLIDDSAVAKAANPSKAAPAIRHPVSFDPDAVTTSATDDAAARRVALDAVSRFDDAVLDLVAGNLPGAQTALAEFKRLLDVASKYAPPQFGIIASGVLRVESIAERSMAAGELKRLVAQGRPAVDKILDVLKEDTRSYYATQTVWLGRQESPVLAQFANADAVYVRLAETYALPADVAAAQRTQRQTYYSLLAPGLAAPVPRTGQQPFDARADGLLKGQLAIEAGMVERFQALDAQVTAYHAMLSRYVALLARTRDYLDVLQVQIEMPSSPADQVRATVNLGSELSAAATQVQRELAAVHNGGSAAQ